MRMVIPAWRGAAAGEMGARRGSRQRSEAGPGKGASGARLEARDSRHLPNLVRCPDLCSSTGRAAAALVHVRGSRILDTEHSVQLGDGRRQSCDVRAAGER